MKKWLLIIGGVAIAYFVFTKVINKQQSQQQQSKETGKETISDGGLRRYIDIGTYERVSGKEAIL